jgi:hypothetical protein
MIVTQLSKLLYLCIHLRLINEYDLIDLSSVDHAIA